MRLTNGETEMGRVTSEIVLANAEDRALANRGALAPDEVRRLPSSGFVDTGAIHMVVPKSIADRLGLPIRGEVTVRYADNRTATRSVTDQLSVQVLGRMGTFRAIIEPDRDTVLIGAIVLEDLDLLVDCTRQVLIPRDPEHITSTIE